MLHVDIKKEFCHDDEHAHLRCLLSEEDEEFLKSLELITLLNTQSFNHSSYNEESPIDKHSVVNYYKFPTVRIHRNFYV